MNHNTVSAECLHGLCSACTYEDCACLHHLRDMESMRFDDARDEAREITEEIEAARAQA